MRAFLLIVMLAVAGVPVPAPAQVQYHPYAPPPDPSSYPNPWDSMSRGFERGLEMGRRLRQERELRKRREHEARMRELERAEAAQRLRMLEEERRRREYEQRQREQAAAAARAQKPDTAEKDPGNDLPLSGEEMAAMINDEGFLKYFYSVVDAQSIEERLRLLKARMEENGWHDAGLEKSIREHKFIALLVERAQRRKERGEQK